MSIFLESVHWKRTCKVFQSKSMAWRLNHPPYCWSHFYAVLHEVPARPTLESEQNSTQFFPQQTRDWFSSFKLTKQRAQIHLKDIHIFPCKRRTVWFHPCDYWYSSWFHGASQNSQSAGLIFLLQFSAAFYLYIFNYEKYLNTPLVSGLQEFSWNETRILS